MTACIPLVWVRPHTVRVLKRGKLEARQRCEGCETVGGQEGGERDVGGGPHVRACAFRGGRGGGGGNRTCKSGALGVVLGLLLLCSRLTDAQFAFQVRFPDTEAVENLPHVDCGAYPGLGTGPFVGLPRSANLMDPTVPVPSCQECLPCTPEPCIALCVNSFVIATTQVNQFNGMDEDVEICNPTDTNGNTIDLNDNDFRISLTTKSSSFNAPNGHVITISKKDLECERGKWQVKYSTSIAGQYIFDVKLKTGVTATGVDILTPLLTADKLSSPFEWLATYVRPGVYNPDFYFIDIVNTLRPVCTTAKLACEHCTNPGLNGGCAGNNYVPSVRAESQIMLYPGDRFKNNVSTLCFEAVPKSTYNLKAVKIATKRGKVCSGQEGTERYCDVETIKEPVQNWDRLVTATTCVENDLLEAHYYAITFTPTSSGFYAIEVLTQTTDPTVSPILTAPLGPLVIPVDAGPVDATMSFAYGNGLVGVIQSELATFTIQPIDRFGNHHTRGAHVFQVQISMVDPPTAFRQTITPKDTGGGTSTVDFQLQTAAVYSIEVRYCKDLLHYPPYSAQENRFCDLDNANGEPPYQGPFILGAPFRLTVSPSEFDLPIISVPGMMTGFRFGDVGVRYYALFTANFPVCGQKYGNPQISERYNPVVRFDLDGMRYSSTPPPMKLTPGSVRATDVALGLYASTRYSEYAGRCMNDGYVFTFMLTVSGSYKAWIYTDTTNPRAVAESPRTFVVSPDVRIIDNFRGSGPVVKCTKEVDCMANQDTWLIIQAKDRFSNNATSCAETIVAHVVPVMQATDYFRVTNLVEFADVGGVPINGVPGPGITQSTRSGYIAQPISDFYGEVKSCTEGMYKVSVLASLSADYRVSVKVDGNNLYGSPFPVTIYPQQRQIVPDVITDGLVTVTRWTYYRVYFDRPGMGFNVEVQKTDDNKGEPWTYMRYEAVFADIHEPDMTAGIRYEYPDARQSIYCRSCRIHIPPQDAKIGLYYIAVYGFEADSFHTIIVNKYKDTFITSGSVTTGNLKPGHYAYYRFRIDTTSGFQIRISSTGSSQGSMTATLKKGNYPATDFDSSAILGQNLFQQDCQDCIIDHPPTLWAKGDWYLAVIGHTYSIGFQVVLLEFSESVIEFGSQANQLTLRALTWGYYTFTIDPDIEPSGFKLDVIPTNAGYNLTTVLKKAQHPITLTDSTFRSRPCTHCRITVMTRQKLQAKWYVGIYAGATGGEFQLKVKLMETCPNDCFGNGVCVQRKIRVCRCFPGYTGIDCRDAVKEKVFAWYPMDGNAADVTDNKRPLFYKVNSAGELSYVNNGLNLLDTYIIIPKPTPDIACSQFTRIAEPEPSDLQWGDRQETHEGTTDRNRIDEVVPEASEWYSWNELGKSKGNPRTDETCAEYNPRREMTIMFYFRVGERGLSPGSIMTLGKPSMIVGRDDADHNGKWSWSLYPQAHPNGRHIVFDMYVRNATHEISLREEDIYPIDGKPIFEKPDFWTRSFPNGWCRNEIRPSRKDGLCEYFEKQEYYHVAAVFGLGRVELYVDAVLVGAMSLSMWNITDCVDCRIQFGHDPRYSPYERLFFGQVRDIRILRYTASIEEIKTLVDKGDSWFKWRASVRNNEGIVSNRGSWEDPIPLSGLDDGALDPDLSAHDEICQSYRTPNEPREMQSEARCAFIDTDTSWILREVKDRYYRKFDTDRTAFGLGHEQIVLLDTRPKQEAYLGRYYDFSIDEE